MKDVTNSSELEGFFEVESKSGARASYNARLGAVYLPVKLLRGEGIDIKERFYKLLYNPETHMAAMVLTDDRDKGGNMVRPGNGNSYPGLRFNLRPALLRYGLKARNGRVGIEFDRKERILFADVCGIIERGSAAPAVEVLDDGD